MGALPEIAVLDELIQRRLDEILSQWLAEQLAEMALSSMPTQPACYRVPGITGLAQPTQHGERVRYKKGLALV